MEFFGRVHRSVNLDAIIGTRMVADQFTVLLNRQLNATDPLHELTDYTYLIENIQNLAEDISDKSIQYVAHNDPPYFKKIGQLLKKRFWEINHRTRDLNMDLVAPFHTNEEHLREEASDNCIAEFFGTRVGATRSCDISDQCWTSMTGPGYIGYSLSHELFYLQIGQQFGCLKELEAKAARHSQPSLDTLAEGFCSEMLLEANSFADNGLSPATNDLFMEQIGLCGMQGYHQFMKPDWLEHILSWQSPNGCYRSWPLEYITQGRQRRKKREEKVLDNGCMCHRTTVASVALSQYTRYLLETLAKRISLPALLLTKPVCVVLEESKQVLIPTSVRAAPNYLPYTPTESVGDTRRLPHSLNS
ncbi:Hypothetical predicted protein [Octopus vulgaris]|uniref:Uncharacterized protein n=1 Tax=Octopus vulgaris TaxID=6645 RepID=A0AA36BPZ3_OCTVU|nr:Hypothetical predicted protein [Octopus vulgaris]